MNVVNLDGNHGNGAREALMDIVGPDDKVVDRLLGELWLRGFKVVPLEAADTSDGCDDTLSTPPIPKIPSSAAWRDRHRGNQS
jgi:hypothetical protein